MARPKNDPIDENQSLTEQETARVTETPAPVYTPPTPPPPRRMRMERQGAKSEPYTRRFPDVRSGICDFCGVIDPNYPSQYQYQMCQHYRGLQLRCSYCPETKNPDEVVYSSILHVAEHPDKADTLIAWCNSFECSAEHIKRFQRSTS